MDVAGYLSRTNVLVVVGKGGVGKTTVAAALSVLGAEAGLDVLLVALDEPGGIGSLFDYQGEFGYDDVVLRAGAPLGEGTKVPGRIRARVLTSDAALVDYLDSHGLRRVTGRLARAGALEVVATAIPGLRSVLVLGKIRQLEQSRAADLIVVDAPATGHALSFLSSAGGLAEAAARGGPLHVQAEQVAEMVTDPSRLEVAVVTIPEEMPVNEAVETAFRLEDEVGAALGPVIANACYPELAHLDERPATAAKAAGIDAPPDLLARLELAAEFRRGRQAVQRLELERLSERLPLGRIELPYLFSEEIGPAGVATLADTLAAGIAAF